jgi:hypothetical protein
LKKIFCEAGNLEKTFFLNMEETSDEVVMTFKPAGFFAQDLVGKLDDDSEVYYDMVLLHPKRKLSTDAVIGIQADVGKVLVLRKTDKTEEFTYCPEPSVHIPFIAHRDGFEGMFIGMRYVIECKDTRLINPDSDDFYQHERQALGMITSMDEDHDDASSSSSSPTTSYIIWCCESRGDEISSSSTVRTLKPAFDPPIYLGDYDHEIKDPREATDIWVSGLNLTRLKKTGNGKVGYERFIVNKNEWKNCHSWTEVLEAATDESGLDIRKEFWDHPEKFPMFTARGKKAFITRREKRKTDANANDEKKQKVVSDA